MSELRLGDSITLVYTATLNGPATALGAILAPGTTVTNTASTIYSTAPANGRTEPTIQSTAQITFNTYNLSGAIYSDANNDGTRQMATEPLITGQAITMRLFGTDSQGNTVNLTTTTTTGLYNFTGLRPGTYRVVEENQPTGFLDGKDTAGTPFGSTGANPSATGKTDPTLGAVGGSITSVVIPVNAAAASRAECLSIPTATARSTTAKPSSRVSRSHSATRAGLSLELGTYTINETQPGLPISLTNGFYDGAGNHGRSSMGRPGTASASVPGS